MVYTGIMTLPAVPAHPDFRAGMYIDGMFRETPTASGFTPGGAYSVCEGER